MSHCKISYGNLENFVCKPSSDTLAQESCALTVSHSTSSSNTSIKSSDKWQPLDTITNMIYIYKSINTRFYIFQTSNLHELLKKMFWNTKFYMVLFGRYTRWDDFTPWVEGVWKSPDDMKLRRVMSEKQG